MTTVMTLVTAGRGASVGTRTAGRGGQGCPLRSVDDMNTTDMTPTATRAPDHDSSLGPTSPGPIGSPARATSPASRPAPRLPAWARVLLTTALFLPVALIGVLLYLIPGFLDLMSGDGATAVLAYAMTAGVILIGYLVASWVLTRFVDRRPARALGWRLDGRALLALVAGYVIAQAVSLLGTGTALVTGLVEPMTGLPDLPELTAGAIMTALAITLLRSFVLQGIGEEVLFRGYLLQSLSRRPILAMAITAAAFTLPHLASSGGQQNLLERFLFLAVPFGFSFSAGFLAIAMRSVWGAVGIHGGFHLATAVTTLILPPTDGAVLWVLLGAMHVVVGVVIAVALPQQRWAEVREHGPYAPRSALAAPRSVPAAPRSAATASRSAVAPEVASSRR